MFDHAGIGPLQLGTLAMTDDDIPEIRCSTLNFNPWPEREHWPVPNDTQRDTLHEIASQVIRYVEEAQKNKDDPSRAISIIVKGERLLGEYTAEKFDQLLPFQQALQAILHTFWRMARRQFIKRALKAPDHEYPEYLKTFREGWLDGPDSTEDFRAAVRHVDQGARLMEGLCRSKAER